MICIKLVQNGKRYSRGYVSPLTIPGLVSQLPEIWSVTHTFLARHPRIIKSYPSYEKCGRSPRCHSLVLLAFASPPALFNMGDVGLARESWHRLKPCRLFSWRGQKDLLPHSLDLQGPLNRFGSTVSCGT